MTLPPNAKNPPHAPLVTGHIKRHLIRLSLPMTLGIMAIIFVNLADAFFIAQLGTQPLAALTFTFPILNGLIGMAFGIGAGTSSIIARTLGQGDLQQVRRLTTHAIILALCLALIFLALGLLTLEPLFLYLGASHDVLPYIKAYLQIWYPGCFLVMIPLVGNSAIRGAGNTKIPGIIMVTVALCNLILDPILIFGWFGLPAMGMQGAALATVIAYAVAMVTSLGILHFRLQLISMQPACFRHLLTSWQAILRIGIPAMGTYIIIPVSLAITTALVANFGSAAVAGYGIAARIEALSIVVLMSLSSVIGPFVGQNWGAQKYRRVNLAIRYSFQFAIFWGLGVAVFMWLASSTIASWFDADPMVIASASRYLAIVPISYTLLGITMLTNNVANGLGKPLPAFLFSLSRTLLIYVPLAFLGKSLFGLSGIFFATLLANSIVGIAAWYWTKTAVCTHQN